MRRRRPWRIAARGLALLLVACTVGTVSVSPAEARVSNADVRKSLRIAYDYWASMSLLVHTPGYHCQRGNVEARWSSDLGAAMASARRGGCLDRVPVVNLERPTIRRLDDRHACAVITHEFGHLLIYGHNRTKGSIMYSSTNGSILELLVPRGATWAKAYRSGYCGRV